MENPFDESRWWDEVGSALNHLVELLQQAPTESMHALQSQEILAKVSPCIDTWQMLGMAQRAGRPRGRFLVDDEEDQFVERLTRLVTECFDPVRKEMIVSSQRVRCHHFFAWIYDAAVSLGVATGKNDLTAFYNLIIRAVKASPHADSFPMAMNTLNNYVKNWEAYVKGFPKERIFLHKISYNNVVTKEFRQRLTNERMQQQKIVDLARQYELLPPATKD